MKLYVLSALAGAALVVALAWSFRSEVACAAEPAPPPRHESMAEVIGAVVEACVRSGGTWVNGVEDGIVLGRCYPLPSVGVVKVAAVRR
jgi:hypothetical protein